MTIFTYAKLDGKKVAWGEVTEYGQSYTGKLLKMHFQIPLVTPIDPAKHTFTYSIYDPSFFIAIEFSNDQPLNVMGNKPDNCSVALGKIAADEKTEETKTMLAGKDAEWQPPTEEDFGSMFAQPVEISCKQ